MKEAFKEYTFKADSAALLKLADEIVARYMRGGYKLTLRQLYYQLVTVNAIKNEEKWYGKVGNILSHARLAGVVDWEAVEDRIRVPWRPPEWDSLPDLVESALYSYRLPRWQGQAAYCELWVEKDALSGVIRPLAQEYHITMMVNRGYSSQTAMYDASKRFIAASEDGHAELHLLYLGDHDPSGEDMVRDIADRLALFGVPDLQVKKIALTIAQVRKYDPPPNPAKMADPRAGDYVAKYGATSWEVDALPPDVLQNLIRGALEEIVDKRLVHKVREAEDRDKEELRAAVADIMAQRKPKGGKGKPKPAGGEEDE